MKKKEMYQYVDHTVLKPTAAWGEIKKLCQEALEYGMASVCIPSCYIKQAKKEFPQLNLCTVVGFPLGYANTQGKLAETKQALEDGASEIDMVINLCDVKNGDYKSVQSEISALKSLVGGNILKVIIETCYLTTEEKIAMCQAVTNGGADYIKTSTGFGTAGADIKDIILMRENIGKNVKIKASGGIRSKEEMELFIKEGCSRIGTSSAIAMLEG